MAKLIETDNGSFFVKQNDNMLELAIRIAVNAHTNQFDKGGNPYILHPLHVMSQMDTEDEKIIAVLHDVIEDTDITAQDLLDWGFSEDIVMDIVLLSRDKNQDYEQYIYAIKKSQRAKKVKLADMRHNSDLSRMHVVEEKHLKMIKKYHWAMTVLT